ncbi:hypothetical protein M440DRAFT_220619 [Trichoderma longibrachiatum ATCC 18648]|uniref:Secreted protein n=1 Tax=Trichoderma longibrachiatum ATCC 18648 TaxID=983965 RepID=A0A2T4BPX6_TRILO|nr:hypothetical protein M440DRAFT_220619 [Trichoderma longibrachiatum ATCC 18648]
MLSAVFSLVMLDALLSARFDDAFAVDVTDLILLAVLREEEEDNDDDDDNCFLCWGERASRVDRVDCRHCGHPGRHHDGLPRDLGPGLVLGGPSTLSTHPRQPRRRSRIVPSPAPDYGPSLRLSRSGPGRRIQRQDLAVPPTCHLISQILGIASCLERAPKPLLSRLYTLRLDQPLGRIGIL